ncbi:hypothetical protein SO802_023566 [Lithocarpus litseifolius]|uniref:Uncharacterized protein n=1 Tax=Lithocarpus litseifolius TaxID=425828 RepID=A0AAW2C789_9ROSI
MMDPPSSIPSNCPWMTIESPMKASAIVGKALVVGYMISIVVPVPQGIQWNSLQVLTIGALLGIVEFWAPRLTKLSKDQANYISVPVEGPYKPAHYRY